MIESGELEELDELSELEGADGFEELDESIMHLTLAPKPRKLNDSPILPPLS